MEKGDWNSIPIYIFVCVICLFLGSFNTEFFGSSYYGTYPIYSTLAFLFSIKVILVIMGFKAIVYKITHKANISVHYILLLFLTEVPFVLIGIPPAWIVLSYWLGCGGQPGIPF